MKRLNGAGTRALEIVKQFTVAQRTIAMIGVAVLVLGGIALASQLSKPAYEVLYSGIAASEASGVTAQLEKDKVPYELSSDGTTIFVPAASVARERLATASLLPSGAGGYSLLDDMGVTASEFQQNVTYKRAIEGELAKTIQGIDGVSTASVQLAIPQQSVFTDEKEDPTASVFVGAASPLSADQVNAIVHLVAAAYPGLTTGNVSVVDQKGSTLSAIGGGTGGTSDTAAAYEAATKASVQTMLDKVLGPGQAVVTVAADVSSSSGTKQSETYTTPSQAPALSETSNSTKYANGGSGTPAASGVLGTDTTTNTSTGGNSATATGGTGTDSPSYEQVQSSKDNAVDKTTTNETIVPGTLNRQSIAVALNASALSTITTSALQQMVSNAAGVNTARGDTVSVTPVPFSNAAAKTAAAALKAAKDAQSAEQMTKIITTAITVVGGLVLLVLLLGLLRKLFTRPEGGAPRPAGTMNIVPMPAADPMLGGYAPPAQLGGLGPVPGALGAPVAGMAPTAALPAPVDGSFARLQADVDALAGSDPEQTAEYLRALMGDRAGV